MKVDQATIVAENLEFARHFFCAILGLSEGPRPPFSVNGQWLYDRGKSNEELHGEVLRSGTC